LGQLFQNQQNLAEIECYFDLGILIVGEDLNVITKALMNTKLKKRRVEE